MSDPFEFSPLAPGAANPEVVFNDNFAAVKDKFDELDAGGGTDFVEEAPADGKQYARKDGGWAEVVASSGGGGEGGNGSLLLRDRTNQPQSTLFPTVLGTDSKLPIFTAATPQEGLRFDFGQKPSTSNDHIRMAVRAAEAGKFYDFRYLTGIPYENYNQAGVILRHSSSGRVLTIGPHYSDAAIDWSVLRWNSQTSYNGILQQGRLRRVHEREWWRFSFDANNLYVYVSPNGKDWFLLRSIAHADFLGVPDQIGLFSQANFNAGWDTRSPPPYVELLYFAMT